MGPRDFLVALNGQLRAKKSPFSFIKSKNRFKGKHTIGFDFIDINTGGILLVVDVES